MEETITTNLHNPVFENQPAIILAGGLGTRLRTAVPDLPKCMAPVAGKPFLQYVINFLLRSGVRDFIFSLGYKHDVIEDFLENSFPALNYVVSIEEEPLGTGGAVMLACGQTMAENVLVLNGDTMFKLNVERLLTTHRSRKAACTLGLKPMYEFERYGVVEIDENGKVQSFKEKDYYRTGLINGGVYALNIAAFMSTGLSGNFSFEKDYLEKYVGRQSFEGIVEDEYFIDIGIPEDFERANREMNING